ncbi:hypothetical protein [Marinomonas atlantica]|uniref:hypothetical protein n=1 Tax=Marinomonas atlantica TaxID=1806668 RepID=UPI000833BF30|nr:hypothetical protein [Marinomonas atlantica]
MCNCMQDTLAYVTEHMKGNPPENAIAESFDTEIMHYYFRMDGSSNAVPAMIVSGSHKVKKVNGEEAKNRKKIEMPIFGRFCPFCAEAYTTPAEEQKLWAVEIHGPGSLVAASSRAEADFRAAEINQLHKDHIESTPEDKRQHLPNVEAVVVEWESSREEHAIQALNNDWSDCF